MLLWFDLVRILQHFQIDELGATCYMLTIIDIYFNFTINVTYRPLKLRHVDDVDWVLLKCMGWVISLQVKGWAGLNK